MHHVLNLDVNDVKYTVKEAKWEERENAESEWSEISSTITAGEFCPHDPDNNWEHRWVGRIVIDDEEDYYNSNILQEDSN